VFSLSFRLSSCEYRDGVPQAVFFTTCKLIHDKNLLQSPNFFLLVFYTGALIFPAG